MNATASCPTSACSASAGRVDAWLNLFEKPLAEGPVHAVFTMRGPCQFSFALEWIGAGPPPPFPGFGTLQIGNARTFRLQGSEPFSLSFNIVGHSSLRVVLNAAQAVDWRVIFEATNAGGILIGG